MSTETPHIQVHVESTRGITTRAMVDIIKTILKYFYQVDVTKKEPKIVKEALQSSE